MGYSNRLYAIQNNALPNLLWFALTRYKKHLIVLSDASGRHHYGDPYTLKILRRIKNCTVSLKQSGNGIGGIGFFDFRIPDLSLCIFIPASAS